MAKVFTTNSNGKVEFTKDELEKLLNEVWQDGYDSNKSHWWTSLETTRGLRLSPNEESMLLTC